jgi:hypothetical protein
MPNYSGTYGTPRLDLGAAFMEFMDNQADFIGARVLSIFRSQKKAATFSAITRESITRTTETKRAPRSAYNRDTFEAKDKSFACEEHGLEGPLDDSERELYRSDFDAELATVQTTGRRVLLAQEMRIAAALFNTTTFTGASLYTDNSGSPWDNAATDVIAQVRAAKEKVRQNTGMMPNAIWFSEENLNRLKANTGIKAAIQYVARLTDAELNNAIADLFGIPLVLIARSIKNTAKEGAAFSGADVWSDDYVQLGVIAPQDSSLREPSVGRTILWSADSPENQTVEQYRDETVRSDIFRVRHTVDEIIIDPYFAHLMKVDA